MCLSAVSIAPDTICVLKYSPFATGGNCLSLHQLQLVCHCTVPIAQDKIYHGTFPNVLDKIFITVRVYCTR